MKIKLANGEEHDITREEAERIAGEFMKISEKESNAVFMKRAQDNIEAVTGMRPTTEDEAKAILYKFMPGWSMKHVEIIFEIMEYVASMHSKKTKIL